MEEPNINDEVAFAAAHEDLSMMRAGESEMISNDHMVSKKVFETMLSLSLPKTI